MAKRTKSKMEAAVNPVLVHFEFIHPTAQRVCIAGTFNEWHCSAMPMIALGEGASAPARQV